jgi:hypothetical protein
LVLAPNGIGNVISNVNILPGTANVRNLGSPTQRWSTIYTQYVDYIAGNIRQGLNIDTKTEVRNMGVGVRIKTIVPVGLLNENQTARWYKLKTEWENNA